MAAGVLLPSLDSVLPERLAAILVHEAFHVWQAGHPSAAWEADELAALNYPAGRADVLHARLEETAALAAALGSQDCAVHTRRALAWRGARHALLSAAHQQYEERAETLEGLAQYVESRFLGELPPLDPQEAARLSGRQWAYLSGASYAFLLSRGEAGWQDEVMRGVPLAALLPNSTDLPGGSPPGLPALLEAAEIAAQIHREQLEQLARGFDALPGKRLVIHSQRLQVIGFDPVNLHVLSGGRILHTRYLNARTDGAEIQLLGAPALAHGPNLLRPNRITLAALPEPTLADGRWVIQRETVSLRLPASRVEVTPDGWSASLD
ncbi:hypothetical protein DEFR109230_01625 [Deinococcus frigens]